MKRLNKTNGFLFGLKVTIADIIEHNYKIKRNKNGFEYYKNYMKLAPYQTPFRMSPVLSHHYGAATTQPGGFS